MLKSNNRARTGYPIHDLIAERWSPDHFAETPVAESDLLSLFEAARWAPSSYNEQPWRYIVAKKEDPEEFRKLLSCLDAGNQKWAQSAPVLVLAVINTKLSRNNLLNRSAQHDLGLATANLVFEAASRNLAVHQMIGILPDKARELYHIPENAEPWTALAIGYPSEIELVGELNQRKRKTLNEFVFGGTWDRPARFIPA
jgi:nitroreductase